MGIIHIGFRHRAGQRWEREAVRASATKRRGRRELRPQAEDLEGRTLLSVGLDPTFGFGGEAELNTPPDTATTSFSQSLNQIALQNGQVVAVGTFTTTPTASGSTSSTSLLATRFTTSGTVDTSFGSNGTTTIPLAVGGLTYTPFGSEDVAVQSSGKIDILAEVSPSSSPTPMGDQFVVVQLNSNGSIDTTFGTGGIALSTFNLTTLSLDSVGSQGLAIGPDGRILVATDATLTTTVAPITSTDVLAVTRINTNGSIDTTFGTAGTATVPISTGGTTPASVTPDSVVVQPNGSVVVVGTADLPNTAGTSFNSPPSDIAVARFTATGTLDTSFNGTGTVLINYSLGGSPSSDTAEAVALQGTQIVIAGTSTQVFTETSGSTNNIPNIQQLTVTRLNANGSFDTTFNGSGRFTLAFNQAGITFNSQAAALTTLSNGELLVGGTASEQNSASSNTYNGVLATLTSTGALDPSYGTNGIALVPNAIGSRMFVQTDGKVVYDAYGGYVTRTTAPVPAVVSTSTITVGTGKKARATGVSITFNTAINPALLNNVTSYVIRAVKGRKIIKLRKRGSISYNATTQTLTLTFQGKQTIGKGFTVAITPGGIVAPMGKSSSTARRLPSSSRRARAAPRRPDAREPCCRAASAMCWRGQAAPIGVISRRYASARRTSLREIGAGPG